MARFKVGVFGSSAGEEIASAKAKAETLGTELGSSGNLVITGACSGLPYAAGAAAKKAGGEVWGFSPHKNFEEQKAATPDDDNSIYTKLFYVSEEFPFANNVSVCRKYRNVLSTAICDAGVIISGRWGTMHEFCSLYDFGKVIGILTDTSGVADELPALSRKISKESKAKVIFNSDPAELVQLVIKALTSPQPSPKSEREKG